MKTKLTISIDEELLPKAKKALKKEKTSISAFVEEKLREIVSNSRPSFVDSFSGTLELRELKDEEDIARYSYLKRKYKL